MSKREIPGLPPRWSFKSFLKDHLADFIQMRKSRGFHVVADQDTLAIFDKYLIRKGVKSLSSLTSHFFLQWAAEELEARSPRSWEHKLNHLRNFMTFLITSEVITKSPLEGLPGPKKTSFQPFVFTEKEVKGILSHLAERTQRVKDRKNFFFPRATHHALFSLQAACGLRISEVIRLRADDFNFKDMTLDIRQSKFRKSRRIPIRISTASLIQDYMNLKKSYFEREPKSRNQEFLDKTLFVSYRRASHKRKNLANIFQITMKEMGFPREARLQGSTVIGAPSPHSLRHSFATNTVLSWKKQGKSLDQISDTLATYMGHSSFEYTRVYLKALSREPFALVFGAIE